MKARLITATAVVLSLGLAAPAVAQSAWSETPMGYTDDGRLNVFGARIDPRGGGWAARADDRAGDRIVNPPAAGYGYMPY